MWKLHTTHTNTNNIYIYQLKTKELKKMNYIYQLIKEIEANPPTMEVCDWPYLYLPTALLNRKQGDKHNIHIYIYEKKHSSDAVQESCGRIQRES